MGSSPTLGANCAGVAELADAQDLKSCDVNSSYRFDSGPRHQFSFYIAGWSSLVARRAHNPKVVGSNPAPAIIGSVAQLVEQWIEAPCVGGSIPSRAIIL